MSLGERIYKLRTEKEMSQGDLADALEVSRQSISKWETNGSVPELDKLVKLSEIFDISLDELVLDKKQPEEPAKPEEPEAKVIYVERPAPKSAQKVAGIVLLCFSVLLWLMVALFGDIVAGLVLAAPFATCGLWQMKSWSTTVSTGLCPVSGFLTAGTRLGMKASSF